MIIIMLKNIVIIYSLSTIVVAFYVSFNGLHDAMGQAVPLIPLTSGYVTLDSGIPKFYACIETEVEHSKNVNDDPYFKKEPTKDEVFRCYESIFMNSRETK